MAHKYGGPWSEVKLDAVEYYLECFTKALTAARMDLWYVDAFAGSGDREARKLSGGILEGTPVSITTETLDGSARRALKVVPPFKHFVFIERNRARCAALGAMKKEFSSRDITVVRSDANKALREIFGQSPWDEQAKNRSRAVVFLDPFSMQVEWSTLCQLAATRAVDVWYLFNVAAINRQLAHDLGAVGNKEALLDRVLSRRWRELYSIKPKPPRLHTLFDVADENDQHRSKQRKIAKKDIDDWFKEVLESQFKFVSEPLPITTTHGHVFSLFLCVANPQPAAIKLAQKFVTHVRKKFAAPASRHRFVR